MTITISLILILHNTYTDFRIAQVRVIFSLHDQSLEELFSNSNDVDLRESTSKHLAYVEWFTKFFAYSDRDSRMYKTSRSFDLNGNREFDIIPVEELCRSAHLIPYFDRIAPQD